MQKVKIDDVLKYEQPTKYIVETENYNNDFITPVLTAGKSFILGYTNEKEGIFNNVPAIIFDDFTTAFHYVDFPFKVKSSAMKILNVVKEKADLKYLFYKMQTISIDKDLHKRYWISKYSQIQISLPDLSTQQKIVAILDKADELRQYNKQLLEKYDALTQSLFLEMFGDPVSNEKDWKAKCLGDMIDFLTSGSRGWAKYYANVGDVFLRIQNVGYNKLKLDDLSYIQTPETTEAKRTKVQAGDIIISITADLGRTGVIPENFPKAFINQHLAILRLKENFNPNYVSAFIASKGGQALFHKLDKGGVKSGLNFTDLKSYNILCPPLSLQNQFAERIQLIETQKQQVQEALAKSEDLFQSLLQRAFKGELN